MSVDLTEDGTVLHLELANGGNLAHAVADAPVFNVEHIHGHIFKGLLDALGTLFQHLHFLVAQRHVVEHHKQLQLVPSTQGEVDDIDNPVCFLEQIQGLVVLLLLDKLNSRVVEFTKDNRYLIFRDP